MMKHALWPWLTLLLVGIIPFLALTVIGAWWVWQQQWFWLWLNLAVLCSGIVWIAARQLNRYQKRPLADSAIKFDTPFSQRDQAAWDAVQALIPIIGQDTRQKLDQIDTWLAMGQQVLILVARHYRPKAKHPEMDIPVTELLRMAEQVCHDLHEQIQGNLPLSHVVTLADGLNLQRWLEHLSTANTALRLGRLILNPLTGGLYEAKNYAQSKVLALTLPRLQDWLLEMYIQKVGHYAILLYSGRVAVEPQKIDVLSAKSKADGQQAQKTASIREPLRFLLAGQTNAGKSSLINSLFDSPRAAADVVSCTDAIMPYVLEKEGQFSGLIFDTPGYGEITSWLADNSQVLDKTDLVLLVCNANNAARSADRRFLQGFQQHFKAQPNRKIPPMLVVVTHIDELHPVREWQPPYDVIEPNCVKAANIRAAMDAIQQDLSLFDNTVIVPVSLSDNDGLGPYNLDSLLLAMGRQMDEANRARLLRCLKDAKSHEKWTRLWQQVAQSSRWFLSKISDTLP
ncbi:50S ribosome-binding GTPase [Methylomonas sp. SURF-2]|uniref:50S ribosome-binding GTPase n=1 Tax=Methylomonas subterranea TaxID=2952225 RepID=A0ABT1TG58_9GAMM|nr:GTPase [Methylomonas sp. SURF-2]MCQ8104444.1 50S ribosome-binding GTPase [Methylomonas sp. SURF-2]